jgi:hypothetical protein
VNIQKELGWLCLESGNYSRAISLLTDHRQRSGDDYEAFSLLLDCFYRTERYEAGMQIAKLMVEAKAAGDCFVNNGLLCGRQLNSTAELLVQAAGKFQSPFVAYNAQIFIQTHERSSKTSRCSRWAAPGLVAHPVVLEDENLQAFTDLLNSYERELQPQTEIQFASLPWSRP